VEVAVGGICVGVAVVPGVVVGDREGATIGALVATGVEEDALGVLVGPWVITVAVGVFEVGVGVAPLSEESSSDPWHATKAKQHTPHIRARTTIDRTLRQEIGRHFS
jgi:hypothetical protein